MAKPYFPTLFGPRADDGRLFRSLKRDIDSVFRDFDHVGFPVFSRHGDANRGEFALYPSVDVVESDEAVEVVAELPGVDVDDLDIQATGSTLVIKGEKKAEYDREEQNLQIVERAFGSFTRTIPMAFQIDRDGVDAAFDNGVLTVTIAKPADVVTKSHPIRITGKTTGETTGETTGKISDKKPDKKPDKTVTEAAT
jgi:HSP20 family protein